MYMALLNIENEIKLELLVILVVVFKLKLKCSVPLFIYSLEEEYLHNQN